LFTNKVNIAVRKAESDLDEHRVGTIDKEDIDPLSMVVAKGMATRRGGPG